MKIRKLERQEIRDLWSIDRAEVMDKLYYHEGDELVLMPEHHDVQGWPAGEPALMYIFSSIIIPQDPSVVESWRDYLFETRIPLFATGALTFAAIVLSNQFIQGASPTHSLEIIRYATIGVFLVGVFSSSARVHVVLAFWPPLFFVLLLLVMSQPERLFQ